jgi:hypothetical protein
VVDSIIRQVKAQMYSIALSSRASAVLRSLKKEGSHNEGSDEKVADSHNSQDLDTPEQLLQRVERATRGHGPAPHSIDAEAAGPTSSGASHVHFAAALKLLLRFHAPQVTATREVVDSARRWCAGLFADASVAAAGDDVLAEEPVQPLWSFLLAADPEECRHLVLCVAGIRHGLVEYYSVGAAKPFIPDAVAARSVVKAAETLRLRTPRSFGFHVRTLPAAVIANIPVLPLAAEDILLEVSPEALSIVDTRPDTDFSTCGHIVGSIHADMSAERVEDIVERVTQVLDVKKTPVSLVAMVLDFAPERVCLEPASALEADDFTTAGEFSSRLVRAGVPYVGILLGGFEALHECFRADDSLMLLKNHSEQACRFCNPQPKATATLGAVAKDEASRIVGKVSPALWGVKERTAGAWAYLGGALGTAFAGGEDAPARTDGSDGHPSPTESSLDRAPPMELFDELEEVEDYISAQGEVEGATQDTWTRMLQKDAEPTPQFFAGELGDDVGFLVATAQQLIWLVESGPVVLDPTQQLFVRNCSFEVENLKRITFSDRNQAELTFEFRTGAWKCTLFSKDVAAEAIAVIAPLAKAAVRRKRRQQQQQQTADQPESTEAQTPQVEHNN